MPPWFKIFAAWAVLCATTKAFADEQPVWLTKLPKDGTYLYYIGRASNEADEASAFRVAINDAIGQVIRENFGFAAQVGTESYEDT